MSSRVCWVSVRRSISTAGVALQPQGSYVHVPTAGLQGAATGQTECLIQMLTEKSHMVYMYVYILPLADFHPEQPEGNRRRLMVQFVFLLALSSCLCWSVGPAVCMCLCVGSIKVFAGMTIANTSPVWLVVGPEGTELQQPLLC